MRAYHLAVVALAILLAGCAASTQTGNPAWVDQMIRKFKSQPVGNPPQSVWRYEYKGQEVYFVPAQCCDMYSSLYDARGTVLCAPDGGFTGQGDGKCPDFFDQRTGEKLVWKDARTR